MLCEIPIFGRCLFCLPLRIGILALGYLNVLFSAFMVGIYSFSIHSNLGVGLVYHGVVVEIDDELCLFIYCLDIVFGFVWVYGAHKKIIMYLKIYYYYAIVATVTSLIMHIITMFTTSHFLYIGVEISALFFAGLCIHVYLIMLTRSLIIKLELSDQHTYENQLHMFINGEVKVDGNAVYPSTVVPNETV